MANNERIYQIKLNGITESVDLVDKLLKRLEDLEKRINNLQGKNVSVGTSGGGGGSSRSGGADLYDRIEKTQEKINQASEEEYKILLKKKAELKEIEKEQKAIVAGERAEQQEYANTLNGQRQKLADMKAALGNITIDSPDFEKQVQEIDALNNKIKQIEQSYGQYGRNVGNYANGVAEGMTKITMTVNGTERTFNNARQALRQLTRERDAMGLNGQRTTEEFKQLDAAVKQLASDINDLNRSSAGMDKLLDTMQGFTAIGSIGTGLQNLFGFDNDKIGESIRKMMSLQSVMQGIEVIRKQMTTNEGLGAIFSGINSSVDKFVTKLRVARAEMKGLAVDAKEVSAGTQAMANGLKTVLNVGAIAGLAYAIEKVYNTLTKTWDLMKKVFGYEDDLKEADRFEMQLKMIGDTAEDTNKQLDKLADQDKISNQEAFNKKMEASQKAMDEYLKLVNSANQLDGGFGKLKENLNVDDLIIPAEKAIDALSIAWDKWGKNVKATDMTLEENLAIWTQWIETGEDGGRNIAEVGRVLAGQYLMALQNCNLATKEGREEFQRLVVFIKSGALQGLFNNVEQIFNTSNNIVTKAMGKVYAQAWAAILKTSDTITDGVKEKTKKDAKKVGMTVQQQEEEITRLRIRAMDEGLSKVVAEINYNAQKEIDALKLTGARKTEAIELIEKERQRKVREAEAKDYRERIEARRNFIKEILNLENENASANIEYIEKAQNAAIEAVQNGLKVLDSNGFLRFLYFDEEHRNRKQEFAIDFNLALTGDERAKRLLEDIPNQEAYWREKLKLNPDDYSPAVMMSKLVVNTEDSVKEMIKQIDSAVDDYLRKIKVVRSSFSGKDEELEKFISDSSKEVTEQIEKIANQYGFTIYGSLRDFQYKTLTDLYNDSLDLQKTYSAEIARTQIENINTLYTERIEKIKRLAELQREELEDEIRKTFGSLDTVGKILRFSDEDMSKAKEFAKNYGGELGAAFASGKISLEEFSNYFDKFFKKYTESRNLIDEKEKLDIINTEQIDKVKELSNVYVGEIDRVVQTIEKQISATQTKYSTQIQTETRDVFGILDLSQTKKITNQTIQAYQTLSTQLEEQLNILKIKFENNQISVEDYNKELQKIIPLWNKIQEELKKVPANAPDFTDFLQSIMPYVSQLANGLSNILGQVSNLISAEFDAQRQALDDELQILEENYNAQEELEQRHADKINAIEDEIANARGARRDYLVDMYNSEIEAQRKAYQEKLKIDAEMKRKEEEQRALEKAERKKQNEIQFQQALMSQSLAILNAFATKPWQVGIAMGALATALTGVQIALMKKAQQASEKYGNGGIVSGNSHAQGGVKAVVGGQRAIELEGNEFIIRKKTATQNLPLLDYINKSERKLNANDLLEFFKGNQGTKNIKNNFKTKFASGGALPSVTTTKASNTIVVVDSRQPVVQVVDILDATKNYENVRVLAGVES